MDESQIGGLFSCNLFPLHHPHKNWWQHERQDSQWSEHQDTQWRDRHVVNRVKATDSWQNRCGSHFARFLRIRMIFQGVPLTGTGDSLFVNDGVVKTEHPVARTFY